MQRNLKAVPQNTSHAPAPTVTQIDEINRNLNRATILANVLYDRDSDEVSACILPIIIEALEKTSKRVSEIKTGSFE